MKAFLIVIVFLAFIVNVFGQNDSGFTNKADAENLIVNGKKEGKWIEYFNQAIDGQSPTKDTNAEIYQLSFYKKGKINGIERRYFKGILYEEIPRVNDLADGIAKYYDNGKLSFEVIFKQGKEKRRLQFDKNGNQIK